MFDIIWSGGSDELRVWNPHLLWPVFCGQFCGCKILGIRIRFQKMVLYVPRNLGEISSIQRAYIFKRVVKPPTRTLEDSKRMGGFGF